MLKLYYILNKILNTKFPACKYKILPPVENRCYNGSRYTKSWKPLTAG